jgi:hypothetical protein
MLLALTGEDCFQYKALSLACSENRAADPAVHFVVIVMLVGNACRCKRVHIFHISLSIVTEHFDKFHINTRVGY